MIDGAPTCGGAKDRTPFTPEKFGSKILTSESASALLPGELDSKEFVFWDGCLDLPLLTVDLPDLAVPEPGMGLGGVRGSSSLKLPTSLVCAGRFKISIRGDR